MIKIKNFLPANKNLGELPVHGVSDDTRAAKKNDLFFVRRRSNFDIFEVLKSIDPKVMAFVAQKTDKADMVRAGLSKPVIFVDNLQKSFEKSVDIFYGFKKNDFKFAAVTGTNGKTTTTFIINHLLNKLGHKSALVGTIKCMVGKKNIATENTTPGYLTLRKLFSEFKKHRAEYVVMEASSHGIDQGRIDGLKFAVCAFTNLTRDHLDYHKTMTNYFKAKEKLFLLNPQAAAIVNQDDEWGRKLIEKAKKVISYGEKGKPCFLADQIRLMPHGSEFTLCIGKKRLPVKTRLMGRHNIYNILAAVGVVYSLGFKLEDILAKLKTFSHVPGRLERVKENIFVDYAHTPDGLEQVLKTLRECGCQKIICLFGCGGDRDTGKRPIMGDIACRLADFSVITSDNPRSEDPAVIIEDVKKGFTKNNYCAYADREEAVKEAVRLKHETKHSCLLLAGKGHENYQVIGTEKLPYSDQQAVRKAIRNAH